MARGRTEGSLRTLARGSIGTRVNSLSVLVLGFFFSTNHDPYNMNIEDGLSIMLSFSLIINWDIRYTADKGQR